MEAPSLIEALDLQNCLPPQAAANVHLDAYLIQQRANAYRKGYQHWRRQAAGHTVNDGTMEKGASGDVSDAVASHCTLNDALQTIYPPTQFHEALKAGGALNVPPPNMRRGGSYQSLFPLASPMNALKPEWTTEDGDICLSREALHGHHSPPTASAAALTLDETLHPEHWTKFYLTPFSQIPLEDIPVAKVCRDILQHDFLPRPRLTLPLYPRQCDSYMVHIGVGGFHRSHQAFYTHELLQYYHQHPEQRPSQTYGICGMGLRPRVSDRDPGDEAMYEVMQQQDHLYTLVFRSEKGTDSHVIGSILDFVMAPHDFTAAIERLAAPSTHIVSLTVTEKGYCQDVSGGLDVQNPAISHDLKNLNSPRTVYGILTASLKLRMDRQQPSYTVLSCDNMPENGDTIKRILLQFIQLCDPTLKTWVEEHTTFPNSMVDRITPVTEEQHKVLLYDEFRLDDKWPVFAEHFGQWVVEDHFVCGRPEWEKVGALFVPDVKPYEYMKLRLLNGTHSALAYISYLAGHIIVDAAMSDPDVCQFVRLYLNCVKSCVPSVPGVDVNDYIEALIRRFSNPYIKDKVARLAEDGSKKLYSTMRGPILELTAAQLPTQPIALAVAGFVQFMSGLDLAGNGISCIRDPMMDSLRIPCEQSCTSFDVQGPLQMVFGQEVATLTSFVTEVSDALRSLQTRGVAETINSLSAPHPL